MQEIILNKVEYDEKELYRRPPREDDCKIIANPPCKILDAETGLPVAICIEGSSTRQIASKLKNIKMGNPLGGGRRLAGYSTGAAYTFGFLPKRPIQSNCQSCRSAAIYRDYPDEAKELTRLAQTAWKLLGEANPERQQHLLDCGNEIKDCWKIAGTGFTSGIINKNTPLRYHYDAGNYPDSWSAMIWIKNGTEGGALAIPRYNAKITLTDGAWLFFPGQSLLHGVTPIKLLSKQAYRYSVVFYSNMEMRNCGTMEEELTNAKKRRTESESKERTAK